MTNDRNVPSSNTFFTSIDRLQSLINHFTIADISSAIDDLNNSIASIVENVNERTDYRTIWQLASKLWDKYIELRNHDHAENETKALAELSTLVCSLLSAIPESFLTSENRLALLRIRIKNVKDWMNANEMQKANAYLQSNWCNIDTLLSKFHEILPSEYKAEEFGHIIIEVCFYKFQLGFILNEQVACQEACSAARSLIIEDPLPIPLSVALCKQFTESVLSTLASDLQTKQNSGHLAYLTSLHEMLLCIAEKQDLVASTKIEAVILNSKILCAICLVHLSNQNAEAASNYFSEIQSLHQELIQTSSLPSQNLLLEGILNFKIQILLGSIQGCETVLSHLILNHKINANLVSQLAQELISKDPCSSESLLNTLNNAEALDADVLITVSSLLLEKRKETDETRILKLLTTEQNRALFQKQGVYPACYSLLWNHGVSLFNEKAFKRASEYFEAAYSYSDPTQRPMTSRVVALCLLGSKNYSRSYEWISLCHSVSQENLETVDCFISFKLALLRADHDACLESLHQMTHCQDFKPDILKIACQEAKNTGMQKLAIEGLLKLHKLMVEGSIEKEELTESFILRSIIKYSLDLIPTLQEDSGKEALGSIRSHFDLALKRLETLGILQFFGCNDVRHVSVLAELEWFAYQSWNVALTLDEKKDYQAATVLFATSAFFMSNHPSPLQKHSTHAKTAYYLAASCALKEHIQLDSGSLETARELIKRGKALKKTDLTESDFLEFSLDFEVSFYCKQTESMKRLLEKSRKMRNISGEHLIKLALKANEGEYKDSEVSIIAFKLALQKLLTLSPPPFDKITMVQRMLIQQNFDGSEKLMLYKEAFQVLEFHQRNITSVPSHELHWLISSCWNQGVHNFRFHRFEIALQYMVLAISLVDNCSELQGKKQSMLQEVEKVKDSVHELDHLHTSSLC